MAEVRVLASVISSRRLFRISSSRELVASFRLNRSVALSLLRLLSSDISFCRVVAISVRVRIWLDSDSSDPGALTSALEPLVMLARGVSGSLCAGVLLLLWVFIFCRASMVAD